LGTPATCCVKIAQRRLQPHQLDRAASAGRILPPSFQTFRLTTTRLGICISRRDATETRMLSSAFWLNKADMAPHFVVVSPAGDARSDEYPTEPAAPARLIDSFDWDDIFADTMSSSRRGDGDSDKNSNSHSSTNRGHSPHGDEQEGDSPTDVFAR